MAVLVDVTDASFAGEVLASPVPVLVDFFGDHCPACRQIAPILDALADDYTGRVRVVRMHAVENATTASRYGIRAMPTVVGFAGGEVVAALTGARPRKAFEALIEQLLAQPAAPTPASA